MIVAALGANLSGPHGSPQQTFARAIRLLSKRGVKTLRHSRWYWSWPVPASDQPLYVNGVVTLETRLDPPQLVRELLRTERLMGRQSDQKNAPRCIDLDLIDYRGLIWRWDRRNAAPDWATGNLILPHPRMHQRMFVLAPMLDVAPLWRHPVTGQSVKDLITGLGQDGWGGPLGRHKSGVPIAIAK